MRNNANWTVLWKTITRVDTSRIIPWIALRNTAGVAIPLVLGLAVEQIGAGLITCTGALNVAFSDGKDPYQQRGRRMLIASVFCGVAVVIGSATGAAAAPATVVAACWAFIAGMMVALGTTAGDIGTVSLVVLVVFASQPMSPEKAAVSGLLALAGGLFQTALSVASWLHRPYEPERRALGQFYASLKTMIESHVDASEAPPTTSQSNEAANALATLSRDYSLEGERHRSLFNQAERARISILAIKRLRARMRRERMEDAAALLDQVLNSSAKICGEISRLLLREAVSIHVDPEMDLVTGLSKPVPRSEAATERAIARDARFQVAALAGQLRSAVSLASHSTGEGQRAFERQEAKKPWMLRLTGSVATIRANLSLRSPAFRHALRLACCVAGGVAIGRGFNLLRPYWIPMTIAIVLKPDFSSTFSRGVLRLIGTYAGLLVATGLFHVISPAPSLQLALLAGFTFLCRCFGPANYGILTAAVSGLVVLLVALTGVAPKEVIAARALNTTIGGLVALLAYIAWPTWERTQLPESMAAMLAAYRKYFRALAQAYVGVREHAASSPELEACRLEARLARSNMEASIERYRAEPGASARDLDQVMSMLASSHRFAHAAMSLEAGLAASSPRVIPQKFQQFFDDVDRTLGLLVQTLRGSAPEKTQFPDLRDAHTRLLEDGGSMFSLLSTETDRITNSLNTLREQVGVWMAEREVDVVTR